MKSLTEQLKKGELESGKEYWVRLTDEWKNSIEQVYFNGEDFERFDIDDIEEVLAPVPSYEELEELKIDNHSLKAWIKNFQPKYKEMEKEKQQLKELLKLCKENIENYRKGKNYYFISDNIIRLIDNTENTIQTNNDDTRKVNLEVVSKMETTTQTNSSDTKPIKDWSDFVVAVGANISSTCIYAPREEGIYGEPSISFDNDGTVWAGGAHGSVCLFRKCPPALMYEMYMQRFNEVGK